MKDRKTRRSALVLAAILTSVSFAQDIDVRISSPSLEYSHVLPDGSVLNLERQTISYPFLLQNQMRTAVATIYFLEKKDLGEEKPARIWEAGYWMDFEKSSFFKPREFVIGIAEGRTSSVALAFWEGPYVRFAEINPRKPLRESFVDDVRRIARKQKRPEDFSREGRTKPDPMRIDFRTILPSFLWDPGFARPPRITRVRYDKEGWHMAIAASQPEMHLQLRDGAKEWVWVNKP